MGIRGKPTDSRVRIKGAHGDDFSLYHTFENSRIFYPRNVRAPVDMAWVSCDVRDRRGGGRSAGSVRFIVTQN
jgi:hypothetical protein